VGNAVAAAGYELAVATRPNARLPPGSIQATVIHSFLCHCRFLAQLYPLYLQQYCTSQWQHFGTLTPLFFWGNSGNLRTGSNVRGVGERNVPKC